MYLGTLLQLSLHISEGLVHLYRDHLVAILIQEEGMMLEMRTKDLLQKVERLKGKAF
jgi:hypothetical protein